MEKSEEKKQRTKLSIKDIVFISVTAALIAVCSWITIPLGDIPITFQFFAVFTAVGILGTKRSLLSVIVWILLGAVGIPVFSGFRGGIGVLFGTTGGYIIGFIFLTLVGGIIIDKFGKKTYVMCIGLFLGMIVCYAFGTAWYMLMYMKNTGSIGLTAVLGACVFPYIIPDLVKLGLAVIVSKAVSPRIKI